MSGPLWTAAEDAVIRKHVATCTSAQIGAMLGRGAGSVRMRVVTLGISLRKVGDAHPNTRYSDALVEQARRMYEDGHKPARIGRELGMGPRKVADLVAFRCRLQPHALGKVTPAGIRQGPGHQVLLECAAAIGKAGAPNHAAGDAPRGGVRASRGAGAVASIGGSDGHGPPCSPARKDQVTATV